MIKKSSFPAGFPMFLLIGALLILLALISPAREAAVFPSYRAGQDQEPSADPNSDFWKGIRGVFIENSILGGAVPNLRAEVRSRWTNDHLYFLFIGPYQTLNLKPDPDTASETYKLWEWDCFEVYLGADFENINLYREFQMSPQGEFLDLAIDASVPKPGWSDERLWNSGMKVKARLDAAGKTWCGEMRIPVSAVDKRPARPGNEMRINLFRQDGRAPKRDFLAWQTTGVWNPHHPDKFGTLRLIAGL